MLDETNSQHSAMQKHKANKWFLKRTVTESKGPLGFKSVTETFKLEKQQLLQRGVHPFSCWLQNQPREISSCYEMGFSLHLLE